MECCLCHNQIDIQIFPNGKSWESGNNAQPVMDGRCCTRCTEEMVINERYKAWDIGYVTYKGKPVQPDELECKRQALMNEDEFEFEIVKVTS